MTLPRLEKLPVGGLSPDQRALYDAIAGGPRSAGPQAFALTDGAGRLEGPFNAMLLSPPIGSRVQELGSAVRYGSSFSDRSREIAILVVAHAWDSDFEVYAHEAVGRTVGLGEDELAAVRDGRPDRLADPVERLTATTALALSGSGDLSDDAYAAAVAGLGLPQLYELVTLVGYYAALALQLRVFRVGSPARSSSTDTIRE